MGDAKTEFGRRLQSERSRQGQRLRGSAVMALAATMLDPGPGAKHPATELRWCVPCKRAHKTRCPKKESADGE